ncbi:hypothetical protein LZQ00_03440 [Sphingobacterium sp. SRCM116780]|uniref:hypothetical protein n=1 Tax=Sphingobacterium sp. SRCM116780 TaxID=2907623 RepID=UPI001F22DECD|nr:hypothetical protein [Sphingobacterium sp. SRCM116780]UIR56879.1 hypothetical protein LZQ00_03440 [Sphingobacterium sp. SRCM116780]
MISKSLSYSIPAVIVLLLSSCSSMYMPNVPAAPMFKDAGEVYVSGNINLKGNISASGGLAITDHIGVIANGSYIDHKESPTNFAQKMGELGVGYFTSFGKYRNRVFEVYAGYGKGVVNEVDQRSSTAGQAVVETRDMDFDKIFVQVNYSSTRRKKIRLFGGDRSLNYGTIVRLSHLDMTDFKIDKIAAEKENNLFIEPVFYTRMEVGRGWQVQYMTGMNFGLQSNDYLKAGHPINSLGVLYKFGGKK